MSFTSQYYTMIIERFHEMENFKIMNLIMLYYPVQDSVNICRKDNDDIGKASALTIPCPFIEELKFSR